MKELEDVYFEGLMMGYWDLRGIDKGSVCYARVHTIEYRIRIDALENEIYGEILSHDESLKKVEWKRAYARWKYVKHSPLMKALA